LAEKETIILKTYDLIKYLFPVIQKFPRDQKFILGDRMQNALLDILELYIKSYYSGTKKRIILTDVNIKLEQLRYLIRLCYDFKYINMKRYSFIFEKVDELGRMTGGWIKAIKNKDENL